MALMQFLDSSIEGYLRSLSPDPDRIQKDMEKLAAENDFPIVGPLVGQFLKQLAAVTQAKNVFEMGSGFGYSAYWFLKGMPKKGKITLTDDDPALLEKAKKYFEKAGFHFRARFECGDALEIFSKSKGRFDIIFIDMEKGLYPKAFAEALPRLRKGGLLIADNVLWSGSVVVPKIDRDALGIKDFNRLTHTSPHLVTTIVPIRDGLSISVKI